MHTIYLSWTTDAWFECARNNHGKMENQDYTFVSIENVKATSNEEILSSCLVFYFVNVM